MNKFWIILFHTYLNKLKSKSFIITTAVTVLLIIGVSNVQNIIEIFDNEDQATSIAVMDETNELYQPLMDQLEVVNEDMVLMKFEDSLEDAEEEVKTGEYEGVFPNERLISFKAP